MKKLILLIAGLFLVGLVGAYGTCEFECGKNKNIALGELNKIRETLDNCKPNYLSCINNKEGSLKCRSEYFTCKWDNTKLLKQKNIEVNNNYRTCLNSCAAPVKEIEQISADSTMTPFCRMLVENKKFLALQIGEKKFKETLNFNKC